MRLAVPLLLLALTGCSTAPVAGLLDCVVPSRAADDRPNRDRDGLPPPIFDEDRSRDRR